MANLVPDVDGDAMKIEIIKEGAYKDTISVTTVIDGVERVMAFRKNNMIKIMQQALKALAKG